MPTLDIVLTVTDGIDDTTAQDFQRAQKIFAPIPLAFRRIKHTLTPEQTRAILGTDGKLALSGGAKEFTVKLPTGAGSGGTVIVEDPKGRFSTEVWAAIRDWTDLGFLHVFYVPDFDPPGLEGGICLRIDDLVDPVIFVNQRANKAMLSGTKGFRGVLEHEIGHAFGLKDNLRSRALMLGVINSDYSGMGMDLSRDELKIIKDSRLYGVAGALGDRT